MAMLSCQLLRRSRLAICNYVTSKRNNYYVLLPEVPKVTPETNPLLKIDSLPPFSKLTSEVCVNAVGKLLIDYETGVHYLDEKLYDATLPKNVQNVILPLDRLSAPLDYVWATFKVLYTLKPHGSIAGAYLKLHSRILEAKRHQYESSSIYRAFKELRADERLLSEPVQRVVHKHLLESQLSGIELSDREKKHFNNIMTKLNEHKLNYRDKLMQCTEDFCQPLEMDDIKDFPKDLISEIAEDPEHPERGPWTVGFKSPVYEQFMENCGNRLLRWNLWHAKCIRSSPLSGRRLNNSIEMENIRRYRRDQANLLGYDTFADMSMTTKMAGNVANVMAMITTLNVKSRVATIREIQELEFYAEKNGFSGKLELWDLPFWQKKYKAELYGIEDATVQQYFPLPKVLRGVFEFCSKLFNISFQDATASVDRWHDDVSFYKILDENEVPIAYFYVDPYVRPQEKVPGSWMEVGRSRSDVSGAEPLSYLIFNFQPPDVGKPCLLSFNDLKTLLQKFGQLLQHSLTTIPYSDVAGTNNLEWDVINVCPTFMSNWITHYPVMASLSSHIESGEAIPEEFHDRIIKNDRHMIGLKLTNELYLSALDMELYTRKEFWLDIMKRLWVQYMPFPLDKNQAHVCSFPEIFCDQHPAAYYSSIWGEMIAADVFDAFEEVGLDNTDAIKHVGQRFRETFLSLGGGCHPSEVFRRFRGRDPSADALLKCYGLNKAHMSDAESLNAVRLNR